MSWNFAGIHFQHNFSGAYERLLSTLEIGGVKTAENLTFSRALTLSGDGTAVGVVNGITVLLNELLPYDCALEPGEEGWLDDILRSLSADGDILNYIIDGRSGTYGFSLFKQSRRIRRWGAEPGSILVDEGPATEAEAAQLQIAERPGTAVSPTGPFSMGRNETRIMMVWEDFTGVSFQTLLQDQSGRFDIYN